MNASRGSGEAPGVWDAAASAEVTAELCASAATLWTATLPAEVATAAAGSLARMVTWAARGRGDPVVRQLTEVYGHPDADGGVLAAQDPIVSAIATGIGVARASGITQATSRDAAQLVSFAALDPLARSLDADGREVLRAHAVATSLAAPLQRVVDELGVEHRRSQTTVASIVAGLAAGSLRLGPDEDALARVVGLLASCSLATGPVPEGDEAWALVVGKAAGNAVLAVSLIERDFSANPRALEGARGLLRALSGTLPADGDTDELRTPRFDVEELGFGEADPDPAHGADVAATERNIAEGVAWNRLVDVPAREVGS